MSKAFNTIFSCFIDTPVIKFGSDSRGEAQCLGFSGTMPKNLWVECQTTAGRAGCSHQLSYGCLVLSLNLKF